MSGRNDILADRSATLHGDASRLARWRRGAADLLPFACLYATFGATFSLLGTGAPLVFRAHGMPLDKIGWLQLIYLPIGVTFLWAPLIDRIRLPGFAHRLGWIVAAQGATVALLLLLSLAAAWPVGLVFAIVLLASVAVATMDVALEALVVETVAREDRPPITTAKLIGSSFGTAVGIALVTALPGLVDLSRAVLIVATLDALLLLPILRYPETARRRVGPEAPRARPALDRLRDVGWHGAIIGLYFAPAIMLGSTPTLALLDLGVSLPIVGAISGPATTIINAVTMVASGALLMRLAAWRLVLALAVGVALSGVLLAGATASHAAALAIAAALINILFEAGLSVPVFNVMYRWAEGSHAATDYAVLFGTAFLVSFPMRVLSPMMASALGWPLFFALAVPFYGVAVLVLARAMKRTAPDAA